MLNKVTKHRLYFKAQQHQQKKPQTQNPPNQRLISCPEYHFTADSGQKHQAILNQPGHGHFLQQQSRI